MNFIKILYNFIKGYLWQIFGLFLSLISLFVLQYLIFLTLGLYSYYYSLNTGFTPNISAQFNNSISKKEVDKIIENIKSKNDVDITYKGYFKELDDGFFVLENKDTGNLCQTLKKNIVLWAIDFDDKQEIEIYQDTKKFRCKVINIGKFGRWFIEISKPEYLQDGKCTIRYKDKIIDMEVYNKDDNAKLRLISNEFLPIFGNFLNDFLNRFIDIRYTGIGIDNYAHNINKSEEQNSFSVYSEKRILAYFNLIFGKSYDSNPVLITRNLMRDVSSYGYITSTILQNDNTTIDLEIIESFEFEPEKNYNTNLILMNKKNFDSIFNTKNKFNLINIYCDIFKEKKIFEFINKKFSNLKVVAKIESYPNMGLQRKVIYIALFCLTLLFNIIMIIAVTVRLFKFYIIFKSDLYLMIINGLKTYIFTWLTAAILLLSLAFSQILILSIHYYSNKILKQFYFAPLKLSIDNYIAIFISTVIILFIVMIFEKTLNNKMVCSEN